MDESLRHKIFTETDCLSEQTMFDYIDKKLSERENHVVEKHLLHCDFCSDALEGLEMVKDRGRIKVINTSIATPLSETRGSTFNYKIIFAVAASLLLLMGGVFFFNMLNQKSEMAVLKTDESTIAPEPPPPPPTTNNEAAAGASAPGNSGQQADTFEETARMEDSKPESDENALRQEAQKPLTPKSEAAADGRSYDGNNGVSSNTATPMNFATAEAPDEALEREQTGTTMYSRAKDETGADKKQETETIVPEKNAKKSGNYFSKETESKNSEPKPAGGKADDTDGDGDTKLSSVESKLDRSGAKEKKKANEGRKAEKQAPVATNAPQEINTIEDVPTPTTVTTTSASVAKSPEQVSYYPGGQDSLVSYIKSKFDPQLLIKYQQQVKETAEVKFTIDKKGKVKNPVIVRGLNAELDKELLRVLKLTQWKPATMNGDTVSEEISLPIRLIK